MLEEVLEVLGDSIEYLRTVEKCLVGPRINAKTFIDKQVAYLCDISVALALFGSGSARVL